MAPKVPHPFKPGVMVSPQRIWQLKQTAMGKCLQCAEPVFKSDRCERHYLANLRKNRLTRRAKLGCKPWKKGRAGRPPLTAKGDK